VTPRSDPYRVLGLVPGATAGEIRSAYRRLAKMHHPDTAGERSLSRFLAIKAAYEELVDGDGRLRARGWPRGGGATPTRPPNPNAKGASRDAWRARRTNGTPGGATGAKAGPGSAPGTDGEAGPAGTGAGPSAEGETGGPGSGARTRSKGGGGSSAGASTGGARPRGSGGKTKSAERRTARPGSTTYDEATLGLDPSWDGAGWYGASSGSYWTLNPREYADPRKHGAEYQERARRAAKLEAQLRARRATAAASPPASADPSGPDAPPTEMPPASSATVEPDADEQSS